jgi:hypothetical protein
MLNKEIKEKEKEKEKEVEYSKIMKTYTERLIENLEVYCHIDVNTLGDNKYPNLLCALLSNMSGLDTSTTLVQSIYKIAYENDIGEQKTQGNDIGEQKTQGNDFVDGYYEYSNKHKNGKEKGEEGSDELSRRYKQRSVGEDESSSASSAPAASSDETKRGGLIHMRDINNLPWANRPVLNRQHVLSRLPNTVSRLKYWDARNNRWQAVGDASELRMLYYALLGKQRFDRKITRNIIFTVNLQMLLKLVLSSHFNQIRGPVVRATKMLNDEFTGYDGNTPKQIE